MDAVEENVGNKNLKRHRAPLSDSEDNVLTQSDMNDGQKRRCLEQAGRENCSPKSSSGSRTDLETKPDTPIVPSVWSRVRQLTQRRDGGSPLAQRCMSDPGSDSPSLVSHNKGFRENLLGENEFHQRLERFKGPLFQSCPSPTPSPTSSSSRTLSNFVLDIQQKLQGSATPSSKQASRIRQEREQELSQLHLQPISENAWLKRRSSDSSLLQVDGEAETKDGSFTEIAASGVEKQLGNGTDDQLDSHNEPNTAEVIDQMFEEVLEYAEKMKEEEDEDHVEDHDSGIHSCSADKDDMEPEKDKSMEKEDTKEEGGDDKKLESNDEILTFPPFGILSPLSKSVEAVVTPMRLAASQQSVTPEETVTPPPESAPLYSIDAYRTQRQSNIPTIQSVTPAVQRRDPEKSRPQHFYTKDKIAAFNEESVRLQNVINQTLQALSCCTDEEHGRGSLEEAEAEKLLLVSCEKRSALLEEIARLREERSSESGEEAEDRDYVSQQPCRGTVSVSNIQLPLKVEYVCSAHNRTGRPSHYFFVLLRYGACNIIATPLATAADAQNGDTISFPTSVTLKDIRSNFKIDVEVYSLSHPSGNSCSTDRTTTKSRVTPRKLLNTITRASTGVASTALLAINPRRSSNFCLVGSHKLTLASLGHSKFLLDKMKLDGKIKKLLGDEFQEKVPFLSPLEGHIYLQLKSESHSNVQHQGFLTMFELISGFGVWHRRYFVLEGCNLYYWNHPNDKETKEAEGSVSLSSSSSQCVKPVKRDSCARPFTFEIVSNIPMQQDDAQEAVTKCWFSADTKQERLDWMDKLNQALLDFHTWSRALERETESQQSETSNSENMRESIL
ncbi:anillin isoform X2 [Thalassophryne amazonica]|uniref:anillin isoform X2 n=1 Tax=Thalassophryne amazonica TaxID=390379 RepID=UPI001471C89E|nr:anillin isoform X2 [Thalassophryne amazonica]